MGSIGHDRRKQLGVGRFGLGVAVVLGAISGLYGSTFGSFTAIFVGVIVAAVGEFAGLTLRGTTRAVLAFGIAVVIGAFGYIRLGI